MRAEANNASRLPGLIELVSTQNRPTDFPVHLARYYRKHEQRGSTDKKYNDRQRWQPKENLSFC
jgi:hypothetical protein